VETPAPAPELTLAAAWIAPVSEPLFGPGWLRIADGRIAEIGRGRPPGPARDLGEAILIPGFVNAHAHLACQLLKGRPMEDSFVDWIGRSVTPPLMDILRSGDRSAFSASAQAAVRELIAGGVTTVADCFLDDAGRRALQGFGLRGLYCREVFGVSAASQADYIAETQALIASDLQGMNPADRVRYGLAPHAPYTCPHETMQAVAAEAARFDLTLSIHVAESPEEAEFFRTGQGAMREGFGRRDPSRFRTGSSPLRALDEAGALGPKTLAVHAVHLDDEDLDLLAARGAAVVHCPGSNFRLGVGIAPLLEMRDRGVRIALGTDSAASNGRLDMFQEMRLAAQGQSLRARRPDALSAATLLEMATRSGAEVLGFAEDCGTLEVGKAADLVAIRLDRQHHRPAPDPLRALVFSSSPSDVIGVWVDGVAWEPESGS
jgi:5-methylthioadenosine/S-adenosylhomocysteine deaminase